MTNSRSIVGVAVIATTLFLGLWLGVNIVTSQSETLMNVAGVGCILICVIMGRRIWVLMPFLGALNLTLAIAGTPTTLLLAQLLFLSFGTLLILMRKLPFQFKFTELEFWMLMVVLTILQVYLQQPGGLEHPPRRVGRWQAVCDLYHHHPELDALWQPHDSDGSDALDLSTFCERVFLNFTVSIDRIYCSGFGVWFGVATGGGSTTVEGGSSSTIQTSRIGFLGESARNLALWISTRISPLRACFSPLWAPLILTAVVFAGLSGFRNEMIALGLTYMVGIFYQGGGLSLLFSCIAGIFMILVLALVNVTFPLPGNIQRSLSFLPGTWDKTIVQGAEDSTEWRVEMWKEALLTDYWIHNKVLGDGLGFTQAELQWMSSFEKKSIGGAVGSGKLTMQQEHMMLTGCYHSGPVSAIRVVGYAGLLVFLAAMIRLAVHAHRQIMRCRGTEWYPLALLIGIPKIWAPLFFVFVFGDFPIAMSYLLVGISMVRLLENNLPLPAYHKSRWQPVALVTLPQQPARLLGR